MTAHSKLTVKSLSGALLELKCDELAGVLACAHWSGADRWVGMRYGRKGSIMTLPPKKILLNFG